MQAALMGEQRQVNTGEGLLEFEVIAMRDDVSVPKQKGTDPLHPVRAKVLLDDRSNIGRLNAQAGETARAVEFMQGAVVRIAGRVPQKVDIPCPEAVPVVGGVWRRNENAFDVLSEGRFIQLDPPDDTRLHSAASHVQDPHALCLLIRGRTIARYGRTNKHAGLTRPLPKWQRMHLGVVVPPCGAASEELIDRAAADTPPDALPYPRRLE